VIGTDEKRLARRSSTVRLNKPRRSRFEDREM